MMDHATKSKHEQESDSGRQWGIINRCGFARVQGEQERVSRCEFVRVLRVLRKSARMRIRNPVPEGVKLQPWEKMDVWRTHLGYETSRGRRGRSVWFGSPDLVKRVLQFVRGVSAGSNVRLADHL